MVKVATAARLDGARKRAAHKALKLLEEHPAGNAYRLVVEVTQGFFVARVREAPGGRLIDRLLVEEQTDVTSAMISRTLAVDLVLADDTTVRYALDGGFIAPVGKARRHIATLRVNQADETPINV